jgi:hypothetical protein
VGIELDSDYVSGKVQDDRCFMKEHVSNTVHTRMYSE